MLRRSPTAITLTTDDVADYEEQRLARLNVAAMAAQRKPLYTDSPQIRPETGTSAKIGTSADPNDELKPLPGDKPRTVRYAAESSGQGQDQRREGRSRDERIGVAR